MKHLSTILILVVVFLISTFSTSFAQIIWTKDTLNNPVLEPGLPGTWDSEWIFCSGILFDSSIYKMWYTGYDIYNLSIGYASSLDGINWTKWPNPVFGGDPNTWAQAVANATVINDGNIYHMWFRGDSTNTYEIGYATSPDGIVWTKNPNPVLDVGAPGGWDGAWVLEPKVIFDNVTFHMWYTGWDGIGTPRIGYATSPDGINWTKYDDPSTVNPPYAESDPVMNPGDPGSWDAATVGCPNVYYDGIVHHMWYSGGDSLNPGMPWAVTGKIGYASSADGITWTKFNNPVLEPGTGNDWDNITIDGHDVVYNNNNYQMWYSGGGWDGTFRYRIGYATAPVTINVPNDYVTIQEAIDAASDGNIVLVADGTYLENINFRGKAITVASHYYFDGDTSHISNTIIDGSNPSHPDSGSVVYFISGEDTTSVLCGFTITGGSGTLIAITSENLSGIQGNDIYTTSRIRKRRVIEKLDWYRMGGGIYCIDVFGAKILNNRITRNRVSGDNAAAGGAGFWADNGFLILENNHISDNHVSANVGSGFSGGVDVYGYNVYARIVNNFFERDTVIGQNWAVGGGLFAGEPDWDIWIILENNKFMNNTLNSVNGAGGGGVYLAGNGKLVNNNISYNSCTATQSWAGGGGIHTDAVASLLCTVNIEGNQINHNIVQGKSNTPDPWAALGGGVKVFHSKALILNNEISHNQLNDVGTGDGTGAGIYMYLAANGSVINGNTISNNTGQCTNKNYGGGIGLGTGNGLSITNNIISGNSASHGGGIRVRENNAAIINNTIVNNTASSHGGGLHSFNSNPIIVNNILWDNQAANGAGIYPSSLQNVRYSLVQGGYTGNGNLNIDPLFVPGDSLYHVMSTTDTSQCLNRGIDSVLINGTWYIAPETDFGGDPRPQPIGTRPDIGAFEYDVVNGLEEIQNNQIPLVFVLKQNYPNPFNPITTIEFSIPKAEHVTLKIYNLLGQEIENLVSDKLKGGIYTYSWDASGFASGVYMYKLEAGKFTKTKKLILIK